MPEYRYRCNDCEIVFDVEEDMEANHLAAPCPQCGQPCDRVWTTPGVVFRGLDFSLALQAEENEPVQDELCDGIEGLSVGTFEG
jgi:putative FmdB family regulatory protein